MPFLVKGYVTSSAPYFLNPREQRYPSPTNKEQSMNLQAQTLPSLPKNEVVGYPLEIADELLTANPNALQDAVMDALHAIWRLSHLLDEKLPAHTELYEHLAMSWPTLPASLPPHMEAVLLDALRQLNSTRQVLQKAWLARAAEADGYWFDGKNYPGQIPLDA